MSDISIRFDGIVLVLAILHGVGVFLIAAVVTGIAALRGRPHPETSRRICARAVLMLLGSLATAGGVMLFMEEHGPWTGPDWLDWLSVPCLAIIASGLWMLARVR